MVGDLPPVARADGVAPATIAPVEIDYGFRLDDDPFVRPGPAVPPATRRGGRA